MIQYPDLYKNNCVLSIIVCIICSNIHIFRISFWGVYPWSRQCYLLGPHLFSLCKNNVFNLKTCSAESLDTYCCFQHTRQKHNRYHLTWAATANNHCSNTLENCRISYFVSIQHSLQLYIYRQICWLTFLYYFQKKHLS